jgi:hypothetical protein
MIASYRSINSKRSNFNHQHREYEEFLEAPNEDVLRLVAMRNIQSIRALAAEAEYIRSKVEFRAFELEFQQLRSHVLGEIDRVNICRDQQRQKLKSSYQDASSLSLWGHVEKKIDQSIDGYRTQIMNSRQALHKSEASMQRAMMDKLLTERRLLKFDEILKIFNEHT